MEKDNGFARGDGGDGACGLLVGEVAAAVHNSIFEEGGAGAGELHLRAIVTFDGENIDTLEVVAEVGC